MERRPAARGRLPRVILAAAFGLTALGAMPWSAAADETPAPSLESTPEPAAEPTTSPSPTPTAAPTASPTPAPTSAPEPTNKVAYQPPTQPPTPNDDDDDSPSPTATPAATSGTVLQSRNLYRYSAMVRQYTGYWCVPATVQTMANLVLGTSNKAYSRQSYIYKLTRQHNKYRYATRGNDPQGWGWSLRYFTNGRPYYPRAYTNKDKAIASIAASIAKTRHPVGVTVFSGTHAWVVLGYKQTYDRSEPSKKTLLGLYVSGPLGTSRDRWPWKYLTVSQFREVFTRYHEWQRSVPWEGKWVVLAQ